MTPQAGLLAHVARAEGHVRKARQSWDPTSLSGCAECAEALRLAVAEMEAACATAAGGPPAPGAKARIERLRSEIDVLARLVDSAIAFCRGLEWRTVQEEVAHSDVQG